MSAFELPIVEERPGGSTSTSAGPPPSDGWLRAARQAKFLAWASLAWMTVEGVVGVLAGVQAHSLGVVTWAASSFVEALASLIVVWRFTGRRTLSATSEARAQKWVAASFFLLAPYFVVAAIRKLIDGGHTDTTVLAVALTISAVVLMPLLSCASGASWTPGPPRERASRTSCARSGLGPRWSPSLSPEPASGSASWIRSRP